MQVASEYNDNSHNLKMNTCPICKLYRDEERYGLAACGDCLMRQVFKACGRRQCMPLHCISENGRKFTNKDHLNQLEAVKEFYFKVIARVRRMTVKELSEPYAFDFMKEIDQKTAEKYGILREVGQWNE